MSLAVTSLEWKLEGWGTGRAAGGEMREMCNGRGHTGGAAGLGGGGEAGDGGGCSRGGRVFLEEFLVYVDGVEALGVGDGEGGRGRGGGGGGVIRGGRV